MALRKSNLKNELLAINERFENAEDKDAKMITLMGSSALTNPRYNNSMRTTMLNSHVNQFLNLRKAEHPHVYFGAENVVGKHSDGYYEAKEDANVYKKVIKFEEICEEKGIKPQVYELFLYNEKLNKYSVVHRIPVEDLSEMFGYVYNCDTIDSLKDGDKIKKGTVLYKSESYDEYNNYGYAKDTNVIYSLAAETYEDACSIRRGYIDEFVSSEIESYTIGLNNNDFLLNIFGNDEEYKTLVDIGMYVDGVVAASRRQFNDQMLFDFRNANMQEFMEGDSIYYGTGIVLDYTIYCNNEEFEENDFNADIFKYLKHQKKYWKEIHDTCKFIIDESGASYTKEIDYLYKRSKEMLDDVKKWREKDSSFSNVVIKVLIQNTVSVDLGQKFSPRYGNKTVVSKIIDDDKMPYYYREDGEKVYVDMVFCLLAIINRTTAYPLYELALNYLSEKCVRYMRFYLKTRDEREKCLFEFLHDIDEKFGTESLVIYNKLSEEEKDEYMNDVVYGKGIYIRDIPFIEESPIFYRVRNTYAKYDWLWEDIVYIHKFGREIPILNRYHIAKMYVMKLKQTSRKGFSARSMGAINSKGLPDRSYRSREHLDRVSSTAIRFGEHEFLGFSVGQQTDDFAMFSALYRTSLKGRKDLAAMLLDPDKDEGCIDDSYVSRVAEIFSVILLSLGYELDFLDQDNILTHYDTKNAEVCHVDGKAFITSSFLSYMLERIESVEKEILSENPVIDRNELIDMVRDRLSVSKKLIGFNSDEEREKTINMYYK